MGNFISAPVHDTFAKVDARISEKMARQAMLQREVQMSVAIAQSRDHLMWFGSLYAMYVTLVASALITKRSVPRIAAVPVFLGAFGLCNLYDFAYGSKLTRVVKEAEYIMDHERSRLIPPHQAPFYKFYSLNQVQKSSSAVSTYWPSFLPISRKEDNEASK